MHLIPPMPDEPPPDYLVFVARRHHELRTEAFRLTGGAPAYEEISLSVLTDLAAHWRRLRMFHRTEAYLYERLAKRTAQWREDQVYEVEVRVLPPPPPPDRARRSSLALRKAAVLTSPSRPALADAEIAWVHAYLHARTRRILTHVAFVLLVVGALLQYMAWLSAGPR